MDYKNKYLKYKNKYLELKQIVGGGRVTASNNIKKNILKQQPDRFKYIINDIRSYYNSLRRDDKIFEDNINNILLIIDSDDYKKHEKSLSDSLDIIISKLCDIMIDIDIDWVYNSYINNTFGVDENGQPQSSFNNNNVDLYVKMQKEDSMLPSELKFIYTIEKLDDIKGLNGLVRYINSPKIQDVLKEIKEKKKKKKMKEAQQKELKENGEDDFILRLDTPDVYVVTPTTEAGSKFYGRNTKWCTSADIDNKFDDYNTKSPLYIIQSKKIPTLKFQYHVATNSLNNSSDSPVSVEEFKATFNNVELNTWFDNLHKYDLKHDENKLIEFPETLNSLYFGDEFSIGLGNSLDKLINLQSLSFGSNFNQPLENSLNGLTNLRTLTFCGNSFNQLLGNSLDKLVNLRTLTLGDGFNQPLGNSLEKLVNLPKLTFGLYFNNPLENSLDKLVNLRTLTFDTMCNFNQPLGLSLDKLANLQTLSFGSNFNQPLENSLNGLTNLRTLTFGLEFDQPLGNSLDKLVNLQTLTFNMYSSFNQPLKNSLDKLENLQKLTFGLYFNNPLENSLDKLVNLRTLTFDTMCNFNQPLGLSLDKLANLQTLTFGIGFNLPLNDSLDKLVNLQTLTFGYGFNQPLGNSLYKLTKLQTLEFKHKPPLTAASLLLPSLRTLIINGEVIKFE